ncbi:hypothetical protein HRI_001486500 [Hibiscus trionum]|uniref:Uncharacterized protein n=1 Tax=Hibiscus trionum TaxID=183268 RepID=A0A9W7HIS4_HIBTR|nr:hypothetical protein HRI_001486500 [Hibiscus trionum]
MEPSEIFGGAEECHSCESGWTMYIGDTAAAADEDAQTEADDDGHGTHASETDHGNHGAETDDSMASDASSGPIQQGQGTFGSKHGEDGSHCYSDKKATKKPSVGKQKLEMKKKHDKEEKQVISFKTNESSTRSPSVRKNMWFGKTK